jgi:hypothetical protein
VRALLLFLAVAVAHFALSLASLAMVLPAAFEIGLVSGLWGAAAVALTRLWRARSARAADQ